MYDFNVFSILSFFSAEVYLILAIYTFANKPKAKVNLLFLLVAFTMAIWGVGEGMQRAAQDPETALFWAKYIIGIGSTLQCGVLVHFWLVFSDSMAGINRKIPIILYGTSLIFLILRFAGKVVTGVEKNYWGYSSVGGALYELFMVYLVAITIYIIILAFYKAKKSIDEVRTQAIYMGIAFSIPVIAGIFTQVISTRIKIGIPELTVVSTTIFFILIARAITRYGMLTITTKIVSENIVATMKDLVIAVDKDMKISVVNDAVLKSLNCERGDITGRPVNDFLDAGKLNSLKYEEILKKLPLSNYEAGLISNDKIKIPVSTNMAIIKEADDRPFGFVLVMRDMREMNELAEELEKQEEEMEKKNIELKEKKKELEEFTKVAVTRESRITELEEKVKKLGHKKND